MSGTVGIVARDDARYSLFTVCLMNLTHPVNTNIDWGLSNDIASARNELVRRSLELGSEWMFFLDDDHVFNRDLLVKLLEDDKDIVSGLYLRRGTPMAPVAFSHRTPGNKYMPIDLRELPQEGLLQVHAVGAGALLVRSEVFRAIGDPWFTHGHVGEWDASEDLIFCERAREAGFEIFVDLEARLGHLAPMAAWPAWIDEEWTIGFSIADGLTLYCPIEKAEVEAAPADAVRR